MSTAGPEPLRTFERRLGRARALGLLALAALAVGAAAASIERRAALERLILDLFAPFGLASAGLAHVALTFGPLLALIALFLRTAMRTGRCAVDEDLLVFEPGLMPAWVARTVIAPDQVVERAPAPGGVVVRAREVSLATPRLLVPTDGPEELEVALTLLDRRAEPPAPRVGRAVAPPWVTALTLTFVTLVLAALALVPWLLERRFGAWSVEGLGVVLLLAVAVSPCLAAFAPHMRRVFVGRRRLAVGEELFAYDELTMVGLGEGFLACAAGRRTCLAWVGDGEAAVRDAIAARLAERGRAADEVLGPLPPAARRLRRRLRAAMLAAPAFLTPPLLVGLAAIAPNHELELLDDDPHGQRLMVVAERDRLDVPGAALLLGAGVRSVAVRPSGWWAWTLGPPDADLVVDLERGELRDAAGGVVARFGPRATFVHVTPDRQVHAGAPDWSAGRPLDWKHAHLVLIGVMRAGRAGGRRPTPDAGVEVALPVSVAATLERLGLTDLDPAVARATLGWTTRRCFEVRDAVDERLVWGVDRGRVVFVVRAARDADAWCVTREGMGFRLGPRAGPSVVQAIDGPRCVRIVGTSGYVEDPTLPTDHATLLEVRRRVEEGATVAEALVATGNPGTSVPR